MVLPALIEDVELPIFLRGKLYADFRVPASYETELAKVLRSLRRVETRSSETNASDQVLERLRSQLEAAMAERRELMQLAHTSGELDKAAEAFESALLEYLRTQHGLEFLRKHGTNSSYYASSFNGKVVEFSVIGRMKNTATPAGPGIKWLLRAEEPPPLAFTNILAQFFTDSSMVQRRMHDGKIRVQWNSTNYLGGLPMYNEDSA